MRVNAFTLEYENFARKSVTSTHTQTATAVRMFLAVV